MAKEEMKILGMDASEGGSDLVHTLVQVLGRLRQELGLPLQVLTGSTQKQSCLMSQPSGTVTFTVCVLCTVCDAL